MRHLQTFPSHLTGVADELEDKTEAQVILLFTCCAPGLCDSTTCWPDQELAAPKRPIYFYIYHPQSGFSVPAFWHNLIHFRAVLLPICVI